MTETRPVLTVLLAVASIQLTANAQQPAPTAMGEVVDETGQAVADAAIWVIDDEAPGDVAARLANAKVRSDATGSFSIPFERRDGSQQLMVAANGRQASIVYLLGEGDRLSLGRIVLPPAATVIGRLRDEQGKPVPGATIEVKSAIPDGGGQNRSVRSGGISDERGVFRVPCVPRTGLLLTILRLGYETDVRIASHESPLAITLSEAPIVRGKLLEADGTPIAGATIRLLQEAPTKRYRSLRVREDGGFAFTAPRRNTRYRLEATAGGPPWRIFQTALLRGPHDDLRFDTRGERKDSASVTVRAVDEVTGERIDDFYAAMNSFDVDKLQSALLFGNNYFARHRGEARLERARDASYGVLVFAKGYAFGAERVPDDLESPLVVELGPAAVLEGHVVDENGAPQVGVAVRAMPGSGGAGSGSTPGIVWPRTDANGKYRIDTLRPGTYEVQVYPSDRQPSAPKRLDVKLDQPNRLDLELRSATPVTVEVLGNLPAGPAPQLSCTAYHADNSPRGFEHRVPLPPPVTLRRDAALYPFGAQQGTHMDLELTVPSRTRVGTHARMHFSRIPVADGKALLRLPELAFSILRGRIEVEDRLPSARIALIATHVHADRPGVHPRLGSKTFAGVAADGSFEIDLRDGNYVLQLADVETGIVFHTEQHDIATNARDVVLRPTLRWLDVDIECTVKGAPAVQHELVVSLERPRNGSADAFLLGVESGTRASCNVRLARQTGTTRWLVPAGELGLKISQAPRLLERRVRSFSFVKVAEDSITIDGHEHSIRLEVPPPPSDAQLEQTGK